MPIQGSLELGNLPFLFRHHLHLWLRLAGDADVRVHLHFFGGTPLVALALPAKGKLNLRLLTVHAKKALAGVNGACDTALFSPFLIFT